MTEKEQTCEAAAICSLCASCATTPSTQIVRYDQWRGDGWNRGDGDYTLHDVCAEHYAFLRAVKYRHAEFFPPSEFSTQELDELRAWKEVS